MSVAFEIDAVLEELRSANKFLLTTHENPDGDALGSLLGMHEVLKALGKDSVMFLGADEFPLPWEYRKMPLDEVQNEPPADLDERTVVFLDCGNIDRMPVDFLQRDGIHIVNVDHHHDNTRFGTVNLVDPQRIVHGRDRLGAREGARRRDHARGRERALRRPRHRHRQVHVHEHLAARAPHGRGADRGGCRRARDLPPPLRGASVRAPAAAVARAERRPALRRRCRDRDRPHARGLRGDRARWRPTPRASSTTSARWRARRWLCSSASSCPRTDRLPQGQHARDRRNR